MTNQNTRVLLSYDWSSHELAELVTTVLRTTGVEVCNEAATSGMDRHLAATLLDSIPAADIVVLLVTPQAIARFWLPLEIGIARAYAKPVVVLYDGLTHDELPSYLSEFRVAGVSQSADALRAAIAELKLAII